ncbi:MAG: ATP-binding cassette domain-containing protein [Dysgonomonas sp.]
MCINIQQLTYLHPDKEVLFKNISFSVEQGQKVALIGDNGSGKSTLLRIFSGKLTQSSGEVFLSSEPYYIPQHFGQYDNISIAQALNIDVKLNALYEILYGKASVDNFTVLDDDWDIEKKALSALSLWGLSYLALNQKMSELSGGEKTKVFLSGLMIHQPDIVLLDEPTNHLDFYSREKLYDFIQTLHATMIIVSHDRVLLNQLTLIYELKKENITFYAGNYEFYNNQKDAEINALQAKLEDSEKDLRLARKMAREVAERKQKHEARGKKNNLKKGVGKMAMDTLQDRAEKSSSKLKNVHLNKMDGILEDIAKIRAVLPDKRLMKTDFALSLLHEGKILVTARNINYSYGSLPLWKSTLTFQIKSGERIAIKGMNGAGKTTLINLITGQLTVKEGILIKSDFKYVFLDQNYSIIDNSLTILEQVQSFNEDLHEHEIKIILNRFLFPYDTWGKSCEKLSGGEKMKLALCCLMVNSNAPDMFIFQVIG